ncbi:ROK family protein [Microlunatus capsulatus]|uniref:ROK family protein n=1 Tax=Microlunatus capsulatus TaxID=99117 RepID=UPI0031DA769C
MSPLPTSREVSHAALLQVLRQVGPTTRAELERTTGLGRKIVSERVQELMALGLVSEGELARSTGGRMPRTVGLQADRGLLGVAQMNLHQTTVALTELDGTVLVREQLALGAAAGPEAVCDGIATTLRGLLESSGQTSERLWAVGVGVLAPVDRDLGHVAPGHLFEGTALAGWDGYPVRQRLADALERPVWVDNEVNLMALGELRSGQARGVDDVVLVKLGPSIGGGLVLGGRLQHGAAAAGEIGHLAVPGEEPRPCWCGGRGCLSTFASTAALLDEARAEGVPLPAPAQDPQPADDEDAVRALVAAAADGHPGAVRVLTRAGERTGAVLAGVVTLLNPALVLLSGTLVAEGDVVVDADRAAVDARAMRVATESLSLTVSPLSDTAGLVGAAAMAADGLFGPRALAVWLDDGAPHRDRAALQAAAAADR